MILEGSVRPSSPISFAHTADETGVATGIIRRDVSPSNVLLSKASKIKLADFGIAKAPSRHGLCGSRSPAASVHPVVG